MREFRIRGLLILSFSIASVGRADPYFMRLGDLPGGGYESQVSDLSDDGSVVAGTSQSDYPDCLGGPVSTTEQTVAPPLDRLRDDAQARGFPVAREYVDEGVSGAKDRRPALDALLADVNARRVDGVAVVKLDRLARSVRHLLTLAADFEALGVELVATDQGIDTNTPSGRFLFNIHGSVAELERVLI